VAQQQVDDVWLRVVARKVQRVPAVDVGDGDARAAREQRLDDVGVAVVDGEVQRRAQVLLARRVDVGAALAKQQAHGLGAAAVGGDVQRRAALVVVLVGAVRARARELGEAVEVAFLVFW
jgi:hypothetical protein